MNDYISVSENEEQVEALTVDGDVEQAQQGLTVDGNVEQVQQNSGEADIPACGLDTQEQAIAIRAWDYGTGGYQVRAYDPSVHTIPEDSSPGGAGYANAMLDEYKQAVKLQEIYTDERYEGRGIATQMLDQVQNYAQEKGARYIYGTNDNESFWEHMGQYGWRTEGNDVFYDLQNTDGTPVVDGDTEQIEAPPVVDSAAEQIEAPPVVDGAAEQDDHPVMEKGVGHRFLTAVGIGAWAISMVTGVNMATLVEQIQNDPRSQAAIATLELAEQIMQDPQVQEALGSNAEGFQNATDQVAHIRDTYGDLAAEIAEGLKQSQKRPDEAEDAESTEPSAEGGTPPDPPTAETPSPETEAGDTSSSDLPQKVLRMADVAKDDSGSMHTTIDGGVPLEIDGAVDETEQQNLQDIPQNASFEQNPEQHTLAAVESLRQVEGLRPDVWQELKPEERGSALQEVETRMATLQGREPMPINVEPLDNSSFGYYDGSSITINANHLAGNELPVQEFVDTVVHEGRHAFQDYAIKTPGIVSESIANTWRENMNNYLSAEEFGQEAYANQPIEADAWSYGSGVASALYADTTDSGQ